MTYCDFRGLLSDDILLLIKMLIVANTMIAINQCGNHHKYIWYRYHLSKVNPMIQRLLFVLCNMEALIKMLLKATC